MVNILEQEFQKQYFEYINRLLSISDLESLLDKICEEAPRVVNGKECSIFLIPGLMNEYPKELINGDGTVVPCDHIDKEFIVLARSTRAAIKDKIGKACYFKGQGLTGWIYEKMCLLNIKDTQDEMELLEIDPKLKWTNKYKGAKEHYPRKGKMPFIGVPLIEEDKVLGVLRVTEVIEGEAFSKYSSEVLTSFAKILSNLIEKVTSRKHLLESVDGLIKILSAREDVYQTIVEEAAHLVGANNCELYGLDHYGEKIDILAATGGYMDQLKKEGKSTSYQRGDGLTGWVFKTGKPLRTRNIHDFKAPKFLSDSELEDMSDGTRINDKDRRIVWLDSDKQYEHHPVPHPYFLGVPIKSVAGEIIGVLRVSSPRSKTFFKMQDMDLLINYAKGISLIFHNKRQEELYNVLKELGNIYNKDKLFEYVVEEIPKLVLGWGCSIFLKQPNQKRPCLGLYQQQGFEKKRQIDRPAL